MRTRCSRPRRRPLQRKCSLRGIIRIGTFAWPRCHAHVHIDLPSRRFCDLEPSSVPGRLVSVLAPRIFRRHRPQPRTQLRSCRGRPGPPALPRTIRSGAAGFVDYRTVEAIIVVVDQRVSRTRIPLAARVWSVFRQPVPRSRRDSLHRAAGRASPQKDILRGIGSSVAGDWCVGVRCWALIAAAFAAANCLAALRSPGTARGQDCEARLRALVRAPACHVSQKIVQRCNSVRQAGLGRSARPREGELRPSRDSKLGRSARPREGALPKHGPGLGPGNESAPWLRPRRRPLQRADGGLTKLLSAPFLHNSNAGGVNHD
jgi:hypothetical protein